MDKIKALPKREKKNSIANNKDWYWELDDDGDGNYDGFLHIVNTIDGSEMKIELDKIFPYKTLEKVLRELGKDLVVGDTVTLDLDKQFLLEVKDIRSL